jgi:hypothetical protein
LVPELDEAGKRVLEDYLSGVARDFGRLADEVLQPLPPAIDAMKESATLDVTILDALFDPLVEFRKKLSEEEEHGGTRNISDCEAEAARIQELIGSITALRWLAVAWGRTPPPTTEP